MAIKDDSAELSVKIDADGNLILRGLDADALERLRARLDAVNVQSGVPHPKVRVEAIIA